MQLVGRLVSGKMMKLLLPQPLGLRFATGRWYVEMRPHADCFGPCRSCMPCMCWRGMVAWSGLLADKRCPGGVLRQGERCVPCS